MRLAEVKQGEAFRTSDGKSCISSETRTILTKAT